MHFINEIPEGQAIIYANGVYRQVKIAERNGRIYAKFGSGYVRLHQNGGSSHPKVQWYEIHLEDGSYEEQGGAVTYKRPIAMAAE